MSSNSSQIPLRKKVFFLSIYFIFLLGLGLIGTEITKIDYKNGPQNRILKKSGGQLIEHHFKGIYTYDSQLGWVPRPDHTQEMWGYPVTLLRDGLRSNGNRSKEESIEGIIKPFVMTFGGSYTFGDNVADSETWPAHLERLTGKKVLNGGVSSYGADQSILRTEALVPKYKPDVLVVSVLRASFRRAQAKVRHGVPKPYFDIQDQKLVLKNVPVPFLANTRLDRFRQIAGYSYFMNKFMDSFFPEYWWQGTMKDFQYVDTNPTELTLLLVQKLNQLARKFSVKTVFLFQGTKDTTEESRKIFDVIAEYIHEQKMDLHLCDTTASLLRVKRTEPELFERYFKEDGNGHMSSAGNAFIAEHLEQCLE